MDDFTNSVPVNNLEIIEEESFNSDDGSCLYTPSDLKKIVNMFRNHEPIRMGISGSM